jgi:isopentenyl-diphosphate Delta-isomerase
VIAGAPGSGLGAVDGLHGAAELAEPAEPGLGTGLDRFLLAHRALPGRNLDEVSLGTALLGAGLAAPLIVAAPHDLPTGAVRDLARAASEHGLGLVLGGADDHAPTRPPLLLASLGVGALRAPDGVEAAERLVSRLDADGLVVDLDELAAALAGSGRAPVRSPIEAIAAAVERLAPLPVVARGGGFGIDAADVRELRRAGVAAIDVGGATGAWGVPTADAVAEAVLAAGPLPVIASGGLRDGVDAAKCLALGAAAAAIDWQAGDALAALVRRLRVAVWATGAPSAAALSPGHLRST